MIEPSGATRSESSTSTPAMSRSSAFRTIWKGSNSLTAAQSAAACEAAAGLASDGRTLTRAFAVHQSICSPEARCTSVKARSGLRNTDAMDLVRIERAPIRQVRKLRAALSVRGPHAALGAQRLADETAQRFDLLIPRFGLHASGNLEPRPGLSFAHHRIEVAKKLVVGSSDP